MPRFSADMGRARLFVARVFALASIAASSSASTSASTEAFNVTPSVTSHDTLDLPSTETRGARTAVPAEGVHRLDGETLRRFATLEDALASLPGFRVRRAGGLGGYSELSFRGARASAVAVYVDGVRLNQDGDGAPDLSKWPSLWFSSLEVRTGFDDAGASSGSLARIDLSTHSAHRAEAHARGGSFSSAEAAAQVNLDPSTYGWRWNVGAQAQSARNDYPVFSDNGTIYNTDDDATWNMDNNAYRSHGARLAARRDHENASHSFSLLWLESHKQYPGLFPSSARAYTRRTDWLAAWRSTRTISGRRKNEKSEEGGEGGAAAWELGAQARRLEDAYRDPNQTLGVFSFEQTRVSTAGEVDAVLHVPFARQPWGAWVARGDLRVRAEDVTPTATPFNQQMASPSAERHEAEAGLRGTARDLPVLPQKLIVTAEARPQFIRFKSDGVRSFPSGPISAPVSETFSSFALRAAAEWPTRAGTWGAVLRREPRAPSSGEFLGDNNGIQHNPTLRAETTRAVSFLHTIRIGTSSASSARAWFAQLQTALYANEYEDPIRLGQRGASPFLRYENGSDYSARGAEWIASFHTSLLESSGSLSLQNAEIREGPNKGDRPAYLNETEAHAELFLIPVRGARLGPLVDYRGSYFPGDANIPVSRRAAEWEIGAHAGYAHGPARLALDARNLLDRRTRDFAYSPRSGRSWSLTLSYQL